MELSLTHAHQVAVEAATSAGNVLREMLYTAAVQEKGPKDLVTDADLAAQQTIERIILSAFPTHRFIGEESPKEKQLPPVENEWTWIVDPLDGTANYVHRLPNFAVSIALARGRDVRVGVVYDPMADELYSAIAGEGATLRGTGLRTSGCVSLYQAMVAASFPPSVRRDSVAVHQFLNVLEQSQSVRRLGSAALNLCYVAEGRLDAYWASCLKSWDIAAGVLIATEAGAAVTNFSGEPIDLWGGEVLVAATAELHDGMRGALET